MSGSQLNWYVTQHLKGTVSSTAPLWRLKNLQNNDAKNSLYRYVNRLKDEAQTALFKDPGRTAQ